MIEIKAPNKIPRDKGTVFLAGSIEMGIAENWQDKVINSLSDLDIVFLNPRRDDWDSSWVQSIENPQFKEQVNWELAGLRYADLVIFYFDPNTKSPITLMELGLVAEYDNVIVCCPEGFWRKGNVDIVCECYNIMHRPTLDGLIKEIRNHFKDTDD